MSVQESKFKDIADAIRYKDGTTAPIVANDFPARIRAIPTGGLPGGIYEITLTANPSGTGTVTGGGYASAGFTCNAKARANTGYQFTAWKENGLEIYSDHDYSFVVESSRNLIAVFDVKPSRLPAGYIELEYIESTGLQHIDTGVKPTSTTKLVMDVYENGYGDLFSNGRCFFGSAYYYGTGSYEYSFYMGKISSGLRQGITGCTGRFSTIYSSSYRYPGYVIDSTTTNLRRILTLDVETGTAIVKSITPGHESETTLEFNTTADVSPNMPNIQLFCVDARGVNTINGTGLFMGAKLYSCQIYSDSNYVRNFVPCTNQNGEVGLYDLVNDVFYGNAGTGEFIAGPKI